MIILLGNTKGGCGKSTLAINICASLAQQGKDVLLVDADRQSTASKWMQERERSTQELTPIHCAQRYGNISKALKDFNNRYEYVIVDAGGYEQNNEELHTALIAADILLTPFRPTQQDLDVLESICNLIKKSRWVNENLIARAILTIAPTTPNIKDIASAKAYISAYPEVSLINTVVHYRKIFTDSMSDGMGVCETKGQSESELKARQEIAGLLKELLDGH